MLSLITSITFNAEIMPQNLNAKYYKLLLDESHRSLSVLHWDVYISAPHDSFGADEFYSAL